MAEEEQEEKKEEGAAEEAAPAGPKESKLPLLIVLVNTIAILGALGTFVYTKMIFKRPPITEKQEREKLRVAAEEKKASIQDGVNGQVEIKSITANIRPTRLKRAPGMPPNKDNLKLHYATLSMVLEIRNIEYQGRFEEIRPIFMDKFLEAIGKKTFEQLTTVQGRFNFRNEVLDLANELVKDTLVSNVYFSEFVVE